MGNGSDSLRRKLGIVCLAVPAGMVILGQTALKSSLDGAAFLLYWLVCFIFTFAAVFIALADMRALRRQTREETRALLEETLIDAAENEEGKPAKPENLDHNST